MQGRVGGKRGDLEVTGWGLGRPTAGILPSRSRWGLRRIGAERGPEIAPSANFSAADCGDQRALPRAARRRRRVYGASILGHVKVTRTDPATLCPWVKRLACPEARLPSPSPLSAVSKNARTLLALTARFFVHAGLTLRLEGDGVVSRACGRAKLLTHVLNGSPPHRHPTCAEIQSDRRSRDRARWPPGARARAPRRLQKNSLTAHFRGQAQRRHVLDPIVI